MVRWEYAMLADPESGTDSVAFSLSQGPGLVRGLSTALDRGLKAEHSNDRFLHLNLTHTTPIIVLGPLGDRGWELCAFSTLAGGDAYWMLRRAIG